MKRTQTPAAKSSARTSVKPVASRPKPTRTATSRTTAKLSPKSSPKPAAKSPSPRRKPSAQSLPAVAVESRTKQAQLIELLESDRGASIAQMVDLTGWQPHTVRGMLSGSLRKRLGLNVRHCIEEGVRVYRIRPEVAAA
ncbi:DUF3489 domain-containing protein [Hydrogenophaga sp. R2]|uniref:DUF3489 domain-containing protein n=1 Tax=Hydrogenophaga sp. R2 TaxID=3132827 RepID=UPI003CF29573